MPQVARPSPAACLTALQDAADKALPLTDDAKLVNALGKVKQTATQLLAVNDVGVKIATAGLAEKTPEVKTGLLTLNLLRRDIAPHYGNSEQEALSSSLGDILEHIGHFNPIITACQTNGRHF